MRNGCNYKDLFDYENSCPSGGMVDAADSKSAAFVGVRVRVSPRAPRNRFNVLI